MGITSDRNDPGLKTIGPDGQQESYLVLSEEERAKGFVRPVRTSYKHVGVPAPTNPLRDLTEEERERFEPFGYVKYEEYPEGTDSPARGRFWTQAKLDGNGCGHITTMGRELAETYARDPQFYGATFCVTCRNHFPVGIEGEFIWTDDGTRVGS